MPSVPSRTADRVATALHDGGCDGARPSEVQGWIDRGWLGPVDWQHPGGGGSETTLGPDAIKTAAVIFCLRRTDRTDDNIVLARFARGLDVGIDELRPALRAASAVLRREAGMDAVTGADEDTIADAAETRADREVTRRRRAPALKAWERGLRTWADTSGSAEQAAIRTPDLVKQVLTPVLAAFAGDAEQMFAAVEPLAAAVGLSDAIDQFAEPGWSRTNILDGVAEAMMAFFEDGESLIEVVTLPELVQARRMLLAVCALAGGTPTIDLLEGRERKPWDGLQITVAMMSVALSAQTRRGLVDPRVLLQPDR